MLKERIQALLTQQRRTVKELSSAIGKSDTAIRDMYKRDSCELKDLNSIADFFGVSMAELLGCEDAHPAKAETRPHIPFEVFAGTMATQAQSISYADCEQRPLIPYAPDYDMTITVVGQSMAPKFESGDIIAIRQVRDLSVIRWGEVYVVSSNDGLAIKMVYDEGQSLRLVSYNPANPPYSIPKDESVRLFRVVALFRNF